MTITLLQGDCRTLLPTLPAGSVQTCVTSPPYYGLRQYTDGDPREIGMEPTPEAYVQTLVEVFREVRRVLRDDGTCWINLGDSYAGNGVGYRPGFVPGEGGDQTGARNRNGLSTPPGLKPKDLIGIPWRVAFALQDDGWYLRSDIIWSKPNCMPESVKDRPTRSHEYLFLFAKRERYYYDAEAIAEEAIEPAPRKTWKDRKAAGEPTRQGVQPFSRAGMVSGGVGGNGETRNRRTVWTVATRAAGGGVHFAVMPEALVEPCILAGSRAGDTVIDPFGGSGTVARVAERLQRHAILCELNPAYITLQEKRTDSVQLEAFV